MKRRHSNSLTFLLLAVIGGIILLGWLFEHLPAYRGVSDSMDAPVAVGAAPPGPGPDTFAVYFANGVHLLQVGRAGDAVETFRQARALRPSQPEVHVNLGYAQLINGDYAAAEASFRAALEHRPGQVNAYYGWAESLEALGDLEAALGAMRTYVHLAPEGDRFVRQADAAIWEWSTILEQRRAIDKSGQSAAGGEP